jgi:LemA protein
MTIVYIIIAIIVLAGLYLAIAYNGLVGARNQVRNAWSQIDVQLKRRHDLIPNLIETVRGYAQYERGTLEAVVNARNAAVQASGANPESRAKAENMLTGALNRLFALVENYPQLRASENFRALQEELTATENRIAFSRQFYNDSVLSYNNKTQMFPTNIIAGSAGFKPDEFFEVELPEEREVPKVDFKDLK